MNPFLPSSKSTPRLTTLGFSLIEMLVVIGIFVTISGIILGNYPSFSHKISVQNLAHSLAIEVRQAQVYGLSVREGAAGTDQFPAFGVYFTNADRFSFILYTDIVNGDRRYNGTANCSTSPECLEKVSIANGDNIRDICGTTAAGLDRCASLAQLDFLNIVFIRPDPDALIVGTLAGIETIFQRASISVEPPKKDFYKTVIVQSTGQISIQ